MFTCLFTTVVYLLFTAIVYLLLFRDIQSIMWDLKKLINTSNFSGIHSKVFHKKSCKNLSNLLAIKNEYHLATHVGMVGKTVQ